MHPLHTEEMYEAFARDTGVRIGARRTGRTTAIALMSIAQAIKQPGVRIQLSDHHVSASADQHLARCVADMIDRLGLIKLKVKFGLNGKSPYLLFGEEIVNHVQS